MFFIASLPRTRTYWLAKYFDGFPGVSCYHELLNGITEKQQFYDAMEAVDAGNVGDSDCGLYLTDFHSRWPDAPVLVVDRPIDDVYASLCDLFMLHGLPPPVMHQLEEQLAALENINALHVAFNDVGDRLPEIHDHLGIGGYNHDYAMAMSRKRLQIEKIIPNPESYNLWRNDAPA